MNLPSCNNEVITPRNEVWCDVVLEHVKPRINDAKTKLIRFPLTHSRPVPRSAASSGSTLSIIENQINPNSRNIWEKKKIRYTGWRRQTWSEVDLAYLEILNQDWECDVVDNMKERSYRRRRPSLQVVWLVHHRLNLVFETCDARTFLQWEECK